MIARRISKIRMRAKVAVAHADCKPNVMRKGRIANDERVFERLMSEIVNCKDDRWAVAAEKWWAEILRKSSIEGEEVERQHRM